MEPITVVAACPLGENDVFVPPAAPWAGPTKANLKAPHDGSEDVAVIIPADNTLEAAIATLLNSAVL